LATRNSYLMRLLEDLPAEDGRVVCENRGTGITTMLEMLRAAGMEPPRFDDRHTTFRLTFANATLLDDQALQWLNRFAGHDLNDGQRLALAYIRREKRLTHADYRRLNPGLDSAEVTRHLADLVQQGLLRQHGTRRWTYYTLVELEDRAADQPAEPDQLPVEQESISVEHESIPVEQESISVELARRARPDQVRAAILSRCRAAPLSARELGQQLQRNPTYLLNRYLSSLVAEGLLNRVGTTPTDPNLRYRTSARGGDWLEEWKAGERGPHSGE
jgi:predicted HTH transcriptional regulator